MPIEQRSTLIDDAIQLFLLDSEARRSTKRTVEHYTQRLGEFAKWLAQRLTPAYLDQITHTHIRLYLIHRQKLVASATQHTEARALRAFFNFCVRDELLAASPFAKVKMPKVERKLPTKLEPDGAEKILESCESLREKSIVLLLLDTGVRAAELLNLNVGDVDVLQGNVVIHLGKGQKSRLVYIGAKTKRQLARYLIQRKKPTGDEPLFVSERGGGRLTYWGLRLLLERIGKRAGIECNAHKLRRTFALWSLRAGMSIYHLQKLMGHADIDVLKHYVALTDGDAKAAHHQFGAVDRLLKS